MDAFFTVATVLVWRKTSIGCATSCYHFRRNLRRRCWRRNFEQPRLILRKLYLFTEKKNAKSVLRQRNRLRWKSTHIHIHTHTYRSSKEIMKLYYDNQVSIVRENNLLYLPPIMDTWSFPRDALSKPILISENRYRTEFWKFWYIANRKP